MAHDPSNPAPSPTPAAWRDLRVRVTSAVVIAPIFLAALWWGGDWWQSLILLLTLGMATEWMAMGRKRDLSMVVRMVTGIWYLAPAAASLVWMRNGQHGLANVLFVVLLVWASDIGAYLAGRLFGGPKLAPRISPGKTRSGAVGGLLCAIGVGVAAMLLDHQGLSLQGLWVAGLISIASQLGDLLESGLKRYFDVKDSGRLIPGHGGLLDRLDGLLLAAPVAAALLIKFGYNGVLWR